MNAVYRGRTRTGCLACRASKVKCDERRPICRRCVRQHKECVFTSRRSQHAVLLRGESGTTNDEASQTGSHTDVEEYGSIQSEQASPPHYAIQKRAVCSPSPSASGQSPSLLSNLISQDIFICTTIDLLATNQAQPSFAEFETYVEHPFVTPYDPANWAHFKLHAVGIATQSPAVTTAILAVQACFRSRRLALSQKKALSSYARAYELLDSATCSEASVEHLDILLITIFLLCLVEVLVPGELRPRLLDLSQCRFFSRLRDWSDQQRFQSSLSLRVASWLLISHAAARRSGNLGLLCDDIRELLETACANDVPVSPSSACCGLASDHLILLILTEPLFCFYFRMQQLSTQVANLSHYHRSRTTGEDQEEVSGLMDDLKARIMTLWSSRPPLLLQEWEELYAQFASSTIAGPLVLLATLCCLTYHTELVELGRNLSAEQAPSAEAIVHLAHIRKILSSSAGMALHSSFLRPLFLYAIESPNEADSAWAVSRIRSLDDPVYYCKFFATFAEGLSKEQRCKERRVTTKWWCLKEFGIDPPYL